MNRIKTLVIGLIALIGVAGCATQTSGPTMHVGPVLSALVGQQVLMDDPTVLTIYATQKCNVAAAQEYRASVLVCTGQASSLVPGFIVPANMQASVQAACQVFGYTNAQNQLIAPSTISVGGSCTAVKK